jgi:hypothetical protein
LVLAATVGESCLLNGQDVTLPCTTCEVEEVGRVLSAAAAVGATATVRAQQKHPFAEHLMPRSSRRTTSADRNSD